MRNKKPEYKYEIVENMGSLTKEADIRGSWCKAVLRTLLNGSEDGIDIRKLNTETKVMSSNGIRLTTQEANELVDILLNNGYGSVSAIEQAYQKRKALYE